MAFNVYLAAPTLVLVAFGYLYWRLFPSPNPGIPYNPGSLGRVLGDAADIKSEGRRTQEPSAAMFAVAQRLGVPVAQMLLSSLSLPIILLDDPREAEDVLVRRNRDFDRSPLTRRFFRTLLPRCTIAQATTPALRAQKRQWSDVMGTDFLRRVVAPNIHAAALELVDLWRIRADRAGGEPFEVVHDFGLAALDAIWVAVLGARLGLLRREIAAQGGRTEQVPADSQAVASGTVMQDAVEYINSVVEKGMASVWPGLTLWWIQSSPRFKRIKKTADAEVHRLMVAACERFERIESLGGKTEGDELDTCAMDLVLRREVVAAKKAGRPVPDPTKDPAMLQELLLLLLAGHDSTANTLCWFVKLITANASCQTILRKSLQSAFPGPAAPSAAEILDADIPYLDAFIEETLRLSATAGIVARIATVDTEILGCHIPAGSNVLVNTRFTHPLPTVPETSRSKSSQAAQEKRVRGGLGGEAAQDLDTFEPRRWLAKDTSGEDVFDPNALPVLTFGGGLRGCFGKKLAMQELRIIIVLLVLAFEFMPLPDGLSSMAGVERLFRRPKTCHARLRHLAAKPQ